MLILLGLTSLRNKHVWLTDVHLFCQAWPLLRVFVGVWEAPCLDYDILLCLLTVAILRSFHSFESLLMILMAFVGQVFMLHSCDLVTFYVCLEMQNFGFLVLCALQESSGVEASLKYLLLSAFSSGMCLYWFSVIYARTGQSVLLFKSALQLDGSPSDVASSWSTLGVLLALLFKLGTAPMHLWMVDIYQSLKRPLLMYLSTAPKLAMVGFWVSAWHHIWTDSSIGVFVCFSMILGSLGAYGQPALRALFAYSTVNEIGLMLLALETAGFHSLFQHLCIYIVTQLLVWNLSPADKRMFSLCAVSLAGLPPLAGFFGKAWIFWHAATSHAWVLLAAALLCTGISLVYYLRVLRLFKPHGF
jgi:NADH:ubiquinone oxidoreductase subunit 2 (subunit N)